MNAAQAKQKHLKDLLTQLGHEPVREDRGEYWYLSPFRAEKEPSFKITKDGKGWYDHGAGEGGNILDFVIAYPFPPFQNADNISSALRALSDLYGQMAGQKGRGQAQGDLWDTTMNVAPVQSEVNEITEAEPPEVALDITKIQPLQNRALTQYLNKRCIEPKIAAQYLQEVYYQWNGKNYFALAFANQSGGFELRNPYFQGCYATKDISILDTGGAENHQSVALFEGFMDFLSALMHKGQSKAELPVIVLNSASMRYRALAAIQQQEYKTVHLYFDHDKTGHMLTEWFQQQLPGYDVIDQSGFYAKYKDFNEWLIAKQKSAAHCI